MSNRLQILPPVLTVVAVIVAAMTTVTAAAAQPEPEPTGETLGRQIAAQLATLIANEYVIDETAREMAATLRAQSAAGKYDGITDDAQLAAIITADLHAIFNDGHLGVLEPARYEKWKQVIGDPDDDGAHDGEPEIDGAHKAAPHKQPQRHGAQLKEAAHGDEPVEREQHGSKPHAAGASQISTLQTGAITTSRVMNRDGRTDIGYLELARFDGTAAGLQSMERVMESFKDVDALIFDLRTCPGGDADMVRALSGYLFAQPTHLLTSVSGKDKAGNRSVTERWTAPTSMGDALADVPVYILTSKKTYSAAESFAFGLKRLERATLVGETTGGGGHMNDIFSLPGGFGASISVGRSYDPTTGEGWQTVGIAPDIACEFDHALSTTLETIATSAAGSVGLDETQAAVHAVLQSYANAWYTGDATTLTRLIDDRFTGHYFQRDGVRLESTNAAQLIAMADAGEGLKTPRALRNRVIRLGTITGRLATATLTLRETVHQMQLVKADGTWKIYADVITDKPRH